jgi:hypothetical protein
LGSGSGGVAIRSDFVAGDVRQLEEGPDPAYRCRADLCPYFASCRASAG